MKIVEIFKSIEGEGKRAGLPATFIRIFGCNCNCSYCDTRYGCVGDGYKDMTILEIVDEVEKLGLKNITITGGEPLIHKETEELVMALFRRLGAQINIETNGSIAINPLWPCFYTIDYKCPSSGMESKMYLPNFSLSASCKDVIKFVVGSDEDLKRAFEIIKDYDLENRCEIYLSPVFGKIEPSEIAKFMLDHDLQNTKVQLQLHKYIWDPNKRGV